MKLIHYIYSLLFFLAIPKQTLAMKEITIKKISQEKVETREQEIETLNKLIPKNSTIKDFKNILNNKNNKEKLLSILSQPYAQKKFNLSLFDINWDIGHLSFDPTKGYEINMIGGLQAGIAGLGEYGGRNHMGAENNIKFFKSQEITDYIINFLEDINLRETDKKIFFNSFSKKDILDFYRNTYFLHYILQYCVKPGKHCAITQEEMSIIEKHLRQEILLQVMMKVLLVSGTYLSYKTLAHIINNYTEPFFDNLKNKKALNMLVHKIDPLKEKTKSDFFDKVFLPEKLKIFLRDFKTIYENPLTKEHKHVIFYGPPGTGKTMIAVKFATEELKKKAIIVNAGMLTSLKNPSGALKNIFEQKNSVIIFDEIESSLNIESLRHELLTYLQNGSGNRSPLVFATTNIPDIQDTFPSLCRPGRFNPVLVDTLQNESDIKSFTNMILKEYNIYLNEEAEEYLLTNFRNEKNITGAKIKNILLCAKELTEDLKKESLIKALNFYSMSIK